MTNQTFINEKCFYTAFNIITGLYITTIIEETANAVMAKINALSNPLCVSLVEIYGTDYTTVLARLSAVTPPTSTPCMLQTSAIGEINCNTDAGTYEVGIGGTFVLTASPTAGLNETEMFLGSVVLWKFNVLSNTSTSAVNVSLIVDGLIIETIIIAAGEIGLKKSTLTQATTALSTAYFEIEVIAAGVGEKITIGAISTQLLLT